MYLVSVTLHPYFPLTNNHHHFNERFNFFSYCQKKTQTSWSSFNSIGTTPLTHFKTSHTLNKRTACCVTKRTVEPSTDTALESEKKLNQGFWFLNWHWVYEPNVCWFLGMLVLAACAPFTLDLDAALVAVALAFLSGFGLTLGYHRLLSHRSYKIPKWLEYFLAYCGAHALQRDPISWVSAHKLHHKHTDTEMDPYTPTEGVWLSYIGFYLYNDYVATKCGENSNTPELKAQRFYQFLHDTYFWHPTALATLLYLYGGFPYLVWGMGVRITVLHLMSYFASSVNHSWGERPWNTPDTSINSWWVSILCLGEGWHNNHHAFPGSARHGLEWWQWDLSWEMIKFLEVVGLATDVKLPTKSDKRRMASLGDQPNKLIKRNP